MVLGARFGFAMHSRQPVCEAMLPETTIIKITQPLPEVLAITCSRPNETLYNDVVLMVEADVVLGVIYSRTLVRLQNGLLQEKIQQLESKQQELNAKNEQMEGDLYLAREVQMAMLPTQWPEITGDAAGRKITLQFCHRYESAGVVSGDFFHVLKISETSVGIFICDVMGHGVRSAFVTAVLRALVEEMRTLGDSPGELLTRVNAELMHILKPTDSPLYATAFYLVADVMRGEIRFARAGHPYPLRLRRSTGELKVLKCDPGTAGPSLGMMGNTIYLNCAQPLEPDYLILLFTDGIYEVFNVTGNEFGSEKLAASLKTNRELPVDKLLDELLAEAKSFSATKSFDDDVCLIALEALPAI
jgi:serine phosphatase RsbU (regulator of sigma subunit)